MSDLYDNPASYVSQTAIFLWQGFMEALGKAPFTVDNVRHGTAKEQELYDRQFDGLGQDGGGLSVGIVAVMIERECNERWAKYDFPSVYHYDIIEPLGAWWAKEGPKLIDFQFGAAQAAQPLEALRTKYNELMAAWLVSEKLTN